MDKVIFVSVLKVEPMTLGEYNMMGTSYIQGDGDAKGYHTISQTNWHSWVPKEYFESSSFSPTEGNVVGNFTTIINRSLGG
jgi:altronate dehydratase